MLLQGASPWAASMRRSRSLQDPTPEQQLASKCGPGGSAQDAFLICPEEEHTSYAPPGLLPSPHGPLCGACLVLEFCNRGSLVVREQALAATCSCLACCCCCALLPLQSVFDPCWLNAHVLPCQAAYERPPSCVHVTMHCRYLLNIRPPVTPVGRHR